MVSRKDIEALQNEFKILVQTRDELDNLKEKYKHLQDQLQKSKDAESERFRRTQEIMTDNADLKSTIENLYKTESSQVAEILSLKSQMLEKSRECKCEEQQDEIHTLKNRIKDLEADLAKQKDVIDDRTKQLIKSLDESGITELVKKLESMLENPSKDRGEPVARAETCVLHQGASAASQKGPISKQYTTPQLNFESPRSNLTNSKTTQLGPKPRVNKFRSNLLSAQPAATNPDRPSVKPFSLSKRPNPQFVPGGTRK